MKFDFMSELTSGQCSIYGQWFAILSAILFLIFSPSCIFSIFFFKLDEPVQGILDLIFGCVIILLEIPIFLKCLPSSPKVDEYIKFCEKNYMRAIVYGVLAGINWIFEFSGNKTSLIIPTLTLTCSVISYGVAAVKREERVTSSLTGTNNFIDLATNV